MFETLRNAWKVVDLRKKILAKKKQIEDSVRGF